MNYDKPPESRAEEIPTPFQRKTLWSALTALSIVVLFATAIVGVMVTNQVLGFLEPVLLPVVIAAVLAYLLEPIVAWLVRKRLSRLWAVITVMTVLVLAVFVFFRGIVPPLVEQTNDLVRDRDRIWNQTTTLVDNMMEQPIVGRAVDAWYKKNMSDIQPDMLTAEELADIRSADTTKEKLAICLDLNSAFMISKVTSWLTSGGRAIFGLAGMVVGLVMTPIFMFYFLKESGRIKDHWHDFLPLKASHFKEEVVSTLQEINGYLVSFFRGQMLVSLIDGALIAIILWALGLKYAFTIGAAVAILGIVPYVGTIVTIIPALLIAWTNTPEWWEAAQWGYLLVVLGVFIGVNQFDGWIIQPKIVGDSVGLHPLTVMFSVLFWTLVLGGLVGALLAVPLTASIKVLLRRYVWSRKKREIVLQT